VGLPVPIWLGTVSSTGDVAGRRNLLGSRPLGRARHAAPGNAMREQADVYTWGYRGMSFSGLTRRPPRFPTTAIWSVVLGEAEKGSPDWTTCSDELVRRYWSPVRWYVEKRWGCSRQDAEDLTQEFFMRLFEGDRLKKASPERGRFRNFVKLELRDLVLDNLRRRTAQKRGGTFRFVPIEQAGEHLPDERHRSLEQEFDRVWAADLLSSAIEDLRGALRFSRPRPSSQGHRQPRA
jgi:RNA polymerase sigma factor (sigma-70 family)